MKPFCIIAVIFALSCVSASNIPREVLIHGNYELVLTIEDLPLPVRDSFFDAISAEESYGVANPNEKWANGCVVGPDRPLYQLIYAAKLDSYWIVAFRSGGFAINEELYIFEIVNDEVEMAWSDMRRPNGESVDSFLNRLKSGDNCIVSPPRSFYREGEIEKCLGDGT